MCTIGDPLWNSQWCSANTSQSKCCRLRPLHAPPECPDAPLASITGRLSLWFIAGSRDFETQACLVLRSSSLEGFVQEFSQAQLLGRSCCSWIKKVWVGAVPKWLEYRALWAASLRALLGTSRELTAETRAAPQNLKLEQIFLLMMINSLRSLVKDAGKISFCPQTTDQKTETQNVLMPCLKSHSTLRWKGDLKTMFL